MGSWWVTANGNGRLPNLCASLWRKETFYLCSNLFTSPENVFTSSLCHHLSLLKSICQSIAISLPKQKIWEDSPILNVSPSLNMSSYKKFHCCASPWLWLLSTQSLCSLIMWIKILNYPSHLTCTHMHTHEHTHIYTQFCQLIAHSHFSLIVAFTRHPPVVLAIHVPMNLLGLQVFAHADYPTRLSSSKPISHRAIPDDARALWIPPLTK